MAFLSLLDDRAKPKGSRDPLGFELVWSHYGRQVIGNLTTVTASLNNFAVALVGFQWANELHAHLPEHERQIRIRDSFLRYEQLTGYLRHIANETDIMGITRVKRRVDEVNGKLSFGMGADQQILSDQASYGLWGLYSAAMRETGLVRGANRTPTDTGYFIAHEIEKRLDKEQLIAMFMSDRKVQRDNLESFALPYRSAIRNTKMQEQLLHTLMNGHQDQLLQQEMWRVTQAVAKSNTKEMSVPRFIKHVKRRTRQVKLEQRLSSIESVERILVAANNIFHYCRRKDGEPLNAILEALSNRYSYAHLPETMDLSGVPRADILTSILHSLLANNVGDALNHVLELNRVVMDQRGGAPWVEIEGGDTLRVRVQSETTELRDQTYLEEGWDYDYFLGSFIRIANDGLGAGWKLR
jgi:hypothetical protein